MTLTEAMHASVPLLVSDVGCSGSIVGDQRMVYRPGNASEFISKLNVLFDKGNRLEEISIGKLALKKSAREYLELYEWIRRSDAPKEED